MALWSVARAYKRIPLLASFVSGKVLVMWYTLITIIHILVCFFLATVVLLQQGKGADVGAVFGGSSQTLFGSTGAGNLLTKLTSASAVIFMLTSLTLTYGAARQSTKSLFDNAPVQTPPPASGTDNPPTPSAATPTEPQSTVAPAPTSAAAPATVTPTETQPAPTAGTAQPPAPAVAQEKAAPAATQEASAPASAPSDKPQAAPPAAETKPAPAAAAQPPHPAKPAQAKKK
jgi:preprotein translocase subunit SecG